MFLLHSLKVTNGWVMLGVLVICSTVGACMLPGFSQGMRLPCATAPCKRTEQGAVSRRDREEEEERWRIV